ncbi:MAG: AtpZ/AtpI family protein [Chloroflexi bacterium]|nr:AtpZ/AtpI family protein [Chloroflexota bacterium]
MDKGKLGAVLRLVGIGWYVAFCIVAGVLGGVWLDGRFHTKLLFTFLGLGGGLVLAFVGLYKMLAEVVANNSNKGNNGE